MDVKSAFLNGFINEEVNVSQTPDFVDFEKPNHVFELKRLFMVLNKHQKLGTIDSVPSSLIISTSWACLLYLTSSQTDIMFSVCLCARFKEDPTSSHLKAVKRILRFIKGTTHLGLWYPKGTGVETIVYADSDHAGDYVNRKSISGVRTFMRCCLTSWFSKKQTALAISTSEAEYVSARKACQQASWMKQALVDCDIKLDDIPVLCDNKGAIDLNRRFSSI
nr:copia protein [Tanacetum cinerariifolium]